MLISTTGQQYQKSPKQAKAKYFSINTWVLAVADQCAYNILAAIKDVTSLFVVAAAAAVAGGVTGTRFTAVC